MGVMINIHYDDQVLSPKDAQSLTVGIKQLVSNVMNKTDVFAFTNHDNLVPENDPIEVFVQVNAAKVDDPANLAEQLADAIINWKRATDFNHKINLNVIPVTWYAKLGL